MHTPLIDLQQGFMKPAPCQRPVTGLRPIGLSPYRLQQMSKQVKVFDFPLEAIWVSPEAGTFEALCWEHHDGTLEVLEVFTGKPEFAILPQQKRVQLDDRGYYRLLQLHTDPVSGTRVRRVPVPVSGRREHLSTKPPWEVPWKDTLPKGLAALQELNNSVALSLLLFPERKESYVQLAARKQAALPGLHCPARP